MATSPEGRSRGGDGKSVKGRWRTGAPNAQFPNKVRTLETAIAALGPDEISVKEELEVALARATVGGSCRSKFKEVGAHWWFSGHHSRGTISMDPAWPRMRIWGRLFPRRTSAGVAVPAMTGPMSLKIQSPVGMEVEVPVGEMVAPVRRSAASAGFVIP